MIFLPTLGKRISLFDAFKHLMITQETMLASENYIRQQDILIYTRNILNDFQLYESSLSCMISMLQIYPGRSVSSTTRTLYSFTTNYRFMSAYRFQQGTASRLYLFRLRLITHHCERTLGCCATHGYSYTPAAYQQAFRLFCKQQARSSSSSSRFSVNYCPCIQHTEQPSSLVSSSLFYHPQTCFRTATSHRTCPTSRCTN